MTNKSLAETFPLSKNNIAAMLAITAREEKNEKSPTAQVMLQDLGTNLKIMFDAIQTRDLDFMMCRVGSSFALDDNFFEYVNIPKIQGVTKMKALGQALNTIQQTHQGKHIHMIAQDEGPQGYEFVFELRDY